MHLGNNTLKTPSAREYKQSLEGRDTIENNYVVRRLL